MEFYSVKHREKIDVADKDVKKKMFHSEGKDGENSRTRYAAVAAVEHKGSQVKLTKFISKDTYDKMDVDVVK